MHLFKQHPVADLAEAARAIPVIDYGPYFAGEPGAITTLAAQLRHACENVGFFYALNHGVDQAVTDPCAAATNGPNCSLGQTSDY